MLAALNLQKKKSQFNLDTIASGNVTKIQATERAFAALRSDGSVVCWGTPEYGGDSSNVEAQLKRVSAIQSTKHAFAALLENGSVVTWGHAFYGGILSISRRADFDFQGLPDSCKHRQV